MSEILTPERLKRAIERRLEQPPEERWADLVRRGIIDEKGRVLKRAPEPPETPKPRPKRKAKTAK